MHVRSFSSSHHTTAVCITHQAITHQAITQRQYASLIKPSHIKPSHIKPSHIKPSHNGSMHHSCANKKHVENTCSLLQSLLYGIPNLFNLQNRNKWFLNLNFYILHRDLLSLCFVRWYKLLGFIEDVRFSKYS